MESGYIYHFSHIFELLAAIYFGGTAIFTFFEDRIGKKIKDKLNTQLKQVKENSALINDYLKLNDPNGLSEQIKKIKLLISARFNEWVCMKLNNQTTIKVEKYFSSDFIQKLFTPIFFFSGCFNLVLVLITPFAKEYPQSIDNFIIAYLYSSVLFYIYIILFFRRNINKKDYYVLTYRNFLSAFILLTLSVLSVIYLNKYDISFEIYTGSELNILWMSFLFFALFFPLLHFGSNFFLILIGVSFPHYFLSKLKKRAQIENANIFSNIGNTTMTKNWFAKNKWWLWLLIIVIFLLVLCIIIAKYRAGIPNTLHSPVVPNKK